MFSGFWAWPDSSQIAEFNIKLEIINLQVVKAGQCTRNHQSIWIIKSFIYILYLEICIILTYEVWRLSQKISLDKIGDNLDGKMIVYMINSNYINVRSIKLHQ